MISNQKVHNNLSSLGTDKLTSNIPKSNDKIDPIMSPKEMWLRKEKQLKIKGIILLLLSQVIWLLASSLEDTPIVENIVNLSIEPGYEIMKLPANIYSQLPKKGEKISATLFREGSSRTISVFLRGYEEDPLGNTGIKAILEIPREQLHFIKNYQQVWKVFPPMTKSAQIKKRGIYEINF